MDIPPITDQWQYQALSVMQENAGLRLISETTHDRVIALQKENDAMRSILARVVEKPDLWNELAKSYPNIEDLVKMSLKGFILKGVTFDREETFRFCIGEETVYIDFHFTEVAVDFVEYETEDGVDNYVVFGTEICVRVLEPRIWDPDGVATYKNGCVIVFARSLNDVSNNLQLILFRRVWTEKNLTLNSAVRSSVKECMKDAARAFKEEAIQAAADAF